MNMPLGLLVHVLVAHPERNLYLYHNLADCSMFKLYANKIQVKRQLKAKALQYAGYCWLFMLQNSSKLATSNICYNLNRIFRNRCTIQLTKDMTQNLAGKRPKSHIKPKPNKNTNLWAFVISQDWKRRGLTWLLKKCKSS